MSDSGDCEVVEVRLITENGVQRREPDELEALLVTVRGPMNPAAPPDAAHVETGAVARRLENGRLRRPGPASFPPRW